MDGALRSAGLRADGARLSASRSASIGRRGLSLSLTTPKSVVIVVAGKPRTLTTTSATVGQLLAEQHLTVRPADRLSVAAATGLRSGMNIRLTRVDQRQQRVTEVVGYSTTTRRDATLTKGKTIVVTAGRTGSREVIYQLELIDGQVADKKALSSTMLREPVARVLRVGTKADRSASTESRVSVASTSGLNWAALAECESGGNPRAVNRSGHYYGLYQFSAATWRSVGGSGLPSAASASEQTYRAQLLYKRTGASSWPSCGRRL